VTGEIHIETHRLMGGLMIYAAEMGSYPMINKPSFIKVVLGI
jgi:hypothetical protein